MGAEDRLLDLHLTCSAKHSQHLTPVPTEGSLFLAELLKTVSQLWFPLLSYAIYSVFSSNEMSWVLFQLFYFGYILTEVDGYCRITLNLGHLKS